MCFDRARAFSIQRRRIFVVVQRVPVWPIQNQLDIIPRNLILQSGICGLQLLLQLTNLVPDPLTVS